MDGSQEVFFETRCQVVGGPLFSDPTTTVGAEPATEIGIGEDLRESRRQGLGTRIGEIAGALVIHCFPHSAFTNSHYR